MFDSGNPDRDLTAIRAAWSNAPRKRVLVVGAGLAGLTAGYLLQTLGMEPVILEAASRVGGRVRTLRTEHGEHELYGELGAMRIPRDHHHTRHLVAQMGLALKPFHLHAATTELFAAIRQDGRNLFPPLLPGRLLAESGYRPEDKEITAILEGSIFSEHLLGVMARQIRECLGDSDANVHDGPDLEGAWRQAVIDYFRDRVIVGEGLGFERIDGGMSRLPETLAAKLSHCLHLEAEVTAIHQGEGGVAVRLKDGHRLEGEALCCTLPFSVLKGVALSGFSDAKHQSIQGLRYTGAFRTLAFDSCPFWLDGAVGEDTQLEGPHALVAYYAVGDPAARFAALGSEVRRERVSRSLADVFRLPRERTQSPRYHEIDWNAEPGARGAFPLLPQHQPEEILDHIARPEGRVFFAGEHCHGHGGWIQHAIASAFAAVGQMGLAAQWGERS